MIERLINKIPAWLMALVVFGSWGFILIDAFIWKLH